MAMDSTVRFSNRVDDYVKFRPGYPAELFSFLEGELGFGKGSVVADVGSGTGISTELLLRLGCEVYAVEPNAGMRGAAEKNLKGSAEFHSVEGTASGTTLPGGSVDFVVAMQAFHWFDPAAARREFQRILRPGGSVVLVWNDRRTEGSAFLEAYEKLLLYFATDYAKVRNANVTDAVLGGFFGGRYKTAAFANEQQFDFAGLKGRLLSSSYAPAAGEPRHEEMIEELRRIFDEYQTEERVRFIYDTRAYYGRLT